MKTLFAGMTAVLLLTAGCKDSFFLPEPENRPDKIFEALWQTFQNDYGPFRERGVDWKAAYEKYRPQVDEYGDDESLFLALTGLMSVLDDGHVNLYAPGKPAFNANKIRNTLTDNDLFDIDIIMKEYLKGMFETDKDTSFVYGLLEENILYVHFPWVGSNWTALGRALDRYPDAVGMIVDLRHNDGGDFTWAFSEMSRLTDQARSVFRSRTKNGPGDDDYTPWYEWRLEPSGSFFDRPLVLLTDRYTISAGERAVAAFQTLPNCYTMGDTTCGAHSTMVAGELANGWKYTIATQNTLAADGRSYEGIGFAPDLYVKNNRNEISEGKDRVLETAMSRF